MSTKKQTIKVQLQELVQLDNGALIDVEELQAHYVECCQELNRLEEQKAYMKAQLEVVFGITYPAPDLGANYDLGRVSFSWRTQTEVDQVETFRAFAKAKARDLLFPSAIQFKLGDNKKLAADHKLFRTYYMEHPTVTLNKEPK